MRPMITSAPLRVLVLGAGFGGLELSTRLVEELGDGVDVTLIDKSGWFMFGYSKLDVMFGRQDYGDAQLPIKGVAGSGVDFRQETILSIDAGTKHVVTDHGEYDADILVVALGADLAPDATPGLLEGGHEFYSPAGAAALRDVLDDFDGGGVVIAVLGGFFKCPPAPYETAFMLHDLLTRRGLRDRSSIHLITPMPKPIPISDEVSDAIVALLDERDIGHWHGSWITHLDAVAHVAHLKDGRTADYDLFLGIPVHVAPPVVVESGLTDDGWMSVDRTTMATRFPDVYAIGDVTNVPVPRAGTMAEAEARTLADVIVSRVRGLPPPPPFAGEATCYMEMGGDTIGMVDVNSLSGPEPTAVFIPPSREAMEQKAAFGAVRRQRWFGLT